MLDENMKWTTGKYRTTGICGLNLILKTSYRPKFVITSYTLWDNQNSNYLIYNT